MQRISRRTLLRGAGAAGLAALVAACTRGAGSGDPTPGLEDVRERILADLGVRAPLELVVALPIAEILPGPGRRLVFGLATADRTMLHGEPATIHLVRDRDLAVVAGPIDAPFHDEGLGGQGVYVIETDLPEAGIYWLVAETPDRAAVGALQVRAQSPMPQVGDAAPPVRTATTADPQGLAELCTREPDCPMHETSLADALAAGRPAVLTVATPKWCQTAICAPVLDVVVTTRERLTRDDLAWIHVEVFEDAGNTPVPLVTELNMLSEPWTFLIGADGTFVDRFEGPLPADLLRASVARL